LNISHTSNIKNLFDLPLELRALIDEIPLGIALLNMDREIILLNRAFESLTGFIQEEAAGICCHHILRSKLCIKGCHLDLNIIDVVNSDS